MMTPRIQRAFVAAISFVTILAVAMAFTVTGAGGKSYAEGEEDKYKQPPEIFGEAAVLLDVKTGKVLFEYNKDERLYPASTTKVMTGMLALENLNLDDIVTITQEAADEGGSQIWLWPDEEISVRELMYATMVESANDAALALAIAVDGSKEAFAERMNAKAKELGAVNTTFVNPNGMPDENHMTTAYDLALMAREAMKNEVFRDYVSTYEHVIPPTNKTKENRMIHNYNRMIFDDWHTVTVYGERMTLKYEGATGVKTGFTDAAGNCLVASATRDGRDLIAVVLKTSGYDVYHDAIGMFEYGFRNFKVVKAVDADVSLANVAVTSGAIEEMPVLTADELYVVIPLETEQSALELKLNLPEVLTAPVTRGDVIGSVDVFLGEENLGSVKLLAGATAEEIIIPEKASFPKRFFSVVLKVIIGIVIAVVVLAGAILLTAEVRTRKRRRRRLLKADKYTREVKRIKRIR